MEIICVLYLVHFVQIYKLNNTQNEAKRMNQPTLRIEIKSHFYINQNVRVKEVWMRAKEMPETRRGKIRANYSDKIWNMLPIRFNTLHSYTPNLIHNQWHKRIHFIVLDFLLDLELFGFLSHFRSIGTESDSLAYNLFGVWTTWADEHVYILQSKDDKHDWWHLAFYRKLLWQIDAMRIYLFLSS